MKILIFCLLVFCIGLQQSLAQSIPIIGKHQIYLFGAGDFYLNQFNVKRTGIATERIYNTPGFKGGLSYNLRLSKNGSSFLISDLSYGRQYNKSGIFYDFNAFYNRTDIPESRLVPFKRKFFKDYLGLFLGYEHRIQIPKTEIKFLLGAKVGAYASFKDYEYLNNYLLETDSINSTFSVYASSRKDFLKGINCFSGQLNMGVQFYLLKTIDCKAILSYSNTLNKLTSEGETFSFYRSSGEAMGSSIYFNRMHHFSLSFSIGLSRF